ncbi:hypothetical protein K438DRAFT_1818912 [Mycena galopus ATCC 62051]|nr:hypothetical protein K438DRAFT_1818912 [Mycena galopus ATCC 62051]
MWLCSCHFSVFRRICLLSAFPPFSDSSRACGVLTENTAHEAGTLFHLTENLSIRRPKNFGHEVRGKLPLQDEVKSLPPGWWQACLAVGTIQFPSEFDVDKNITTK